MLEVKNINVHYGAAQILWGVSFNVEIGKVTTLLGRNGVGKTTSLKAVVGQVPISGGQIVWQGEDISKMRPADRAKRRIAYVPQGREIFPFLTVKENMETAYAAVGPGERMIPDEIYELFPVLKSMLRRRGGDLSGGQQQQLAIARALVMRPLLLVLDEPTEGIQPSIIKDIENVIAYLRDQGTMAILLVEQYFDFAQELADQFAVMDRGEVVLEGVPQDVDEEEVKKIISI